MPYLNATQAAKQLGVHEKTVRRWIDQGLLPASHIRVNRYAIDLNDILRLQKRRQTEDISSSADSETHARLATVEHEVDNLQRRMAALESQQAIQREQDSSIPMPPTYTPRIEPQRETEGTLPGGYVTARKFAINHGFSRDRMETWIRLKAFETTLTPYGKQTQHILSVEQQQGVIGYWERNHIPYKPCDLCPHT